MQILVKGTVSHPILVKGTISHTQYLFRGAFSEKGKYLFRVLFETLWSRMISTGQWRWPPGISFYLG